MAQHRHEDPVATNGAPRHALVCWTAASLLVAGIVVRALLLRDLPALLTNDSWDFLRAADDIRLHLDFFSLGLRDVRLPGYPIFLALTETFVGNHSDAIAATQAALGVAGAIAGFGLGYALGSLWAGLLMAGFLGLNPVFLLNEHAIMSETLGLLLAVLLVCLGVLILERGSGPSAWAFMGLLFGACVLTRANFAVLGVVMVSALGLTPPRVRSATSGNDPIRSRTGRLAPILVAVAVGSLLIAPWVWRNHVAYGRPSLYLFTNRNMLVYKNMHHPLDAAAPTLARTNEILGDGRVGYQWLWKLNARYPPAEAEAIAGEILREQIARRPTRYLREVAGAFAGFLGCSSRYGDARTYLLFWFRELVPDVARVRDEASAGLEVARPEGFRYGARADDGPAGRGLAAAGAAFLRPGRSIAMLAFAGLLSVYLMAQWIDGPQQHAPRLLAVVVLLVGFLASVGIHSLMLTDNDRYSTSFDFVLVLAAGLMVDELLARQSARRRRR